PVSGFFPAIRSFSTITSSPRCFRSSVSRQLRLRPPVDPFKCRRVSADGADALSESSAPARSEKKDFSLILGIMLGAASHSAKPFARCRIGAKSVPNHAEPRELRAPPSRTVARFLLGKIVRGLQSLLQLVTSDLRVRGSDPAAW